MKKLMTIINESQLKASNKLKRIALLINDRINDKANDEMNDSLMTASTVRSS